MPPKTECPVHISVRHDGRSLVKGSPGVPNSLPRLQTVIEIRPARGITFKCRSVGIELLTVQKVVTPSTIGSNEAVKHTRVFQDPTVYAPPMGQFSQEMMALDVPIFIPLDRSIVASGYFENWGATTVHVLSVRVCVGASAGTEANFAQEFTVPVKLYDTLPLYRQFNEPVCQTQSASDDQVVLDVVLPVSAVGPSDAIELSVKVAANHMCSKRKKNLGLRSVTVHLKEIMEGFDGGLPAKKDLKLLSETRTHDKPLTTVGIEDAFSFVLPYENDTLDLFSLSNVYDYSEEHVQSVSATFNRNKNYGKLADGVPLTHVQGFTTHGKLFSLRYEIAVKVKVSHGKDLECVVPLTVSPFNRASSAYLMQWIKTECQYAQDRFGRDTVKEVALCSRQDDTYRLTRRFCPPPTVYVYNATNWARLGYIPEVFGRPTSDKQLVRLID